MSKILCIDLDGTLFWPKQKKRYVSKKNTEFLRKFIDQGNRVLLITSRCPDLLDNVVKEIDRPIDYAAMCGGIIKVDGKIIQDKPLDNNIAKEMIENINREYCPVGYANTTASCPVLVSSGPKPLSEFVKKLYLRWYNKMGIYREHLEISETKIYEELEHGKVYSLKIFFGLSRRKNKINKELNKRIRESYPQVEASWIGLAIEISPKGCSKAESIETYANYVGAKKDDIYVIGDSGNDISMFNKYHEHSFVMAHGYPSVKKYAKYVVSRVHKLDKYLIEEEKQ